MPIYPFVVLGLLLVGIVAIPPFVAALIDMNRENQQSEIKTRKGECDG